MDFIRCGFHFCAVDLNGLHLQPVLRILDILVWIRIIDLQDANKKLFKKSRVFLLFLLNDRRIRSRIRIHISDKCIRIQEAQKHVDPVDPDPDPQHCLQQLVFLFCAAHLLLKCRV